jgi:hypothetical protein
MLILHIVPLYISLKIVIKIHILKNFFKINRQIQECLIVFIYPQIHFVLCIDCIAQRQGF